MKVYVTKYALTIGILLCDVKILNSVTSRDLKTKVYYFEGDFFHTESEAIKDAEQRKEKKLIQLQNQISKLENKNVTIIKEV